MSQPDPTPLAAAALAADEWAPDGPARALLHGIAARLTADERAALETWLRAVADHQTAQAREIAALRAALTRYLDNDDCQCDPADGFDVCHWCQAAAALGQAVADSERSAAWHRAQEATK